MRPCGVMLNTWGGDGVGVGSGVTVGGLTGGLEVGGGNDVKAFTAVVSEGLVVP